jgi:glycosyltransferase involved in cell wall biosynthesis
MKILTNIRFAQTAGIAQTLGCFLDFVRKNKSLGIEVIGVNIMDSKKNFYRKNKKDNVSIISMGINVPNIKNAVAGSKNIKDVEVRYANVIESYQEIIRKENPDLILVNGTYYIPWCLFMAAKKESVPVVLHYHGVLTLETKNWPAKETKIFREMEQSFDKKSLFYIFPSNITKKVVEKEIYKHKIKNSVTIPNPVPLHFFKNKKLSNAVNIGIVSRWASIKNTDFCEALAEYNKTNGGKFKINIITDLEKSDKRYKKISKIAKIHPACENKELINFYKNMGIIISPSHFETYGNVAKEALASGVPAMVSKNMGVSETFKKLGLHKWVIDFDSVENVYAKIEKIIGTAVENKTRNKIKNSYSPEKIFSATISVLKLASENAQTLN